MLGIAIALGTILGVFVDERATRWIVAMATLLMAGLLVHQMRRSRMRVVAELERRASNDSLTGLFNRVALEERAILELARARRMNSSLSLVVLDIDGFKAFNDSQGHPAGDELLRRVARQLKFETRQADALARLGGDEFAVLLPDTPTHEAATFAGRLSRVAVGRRRVAGNRLDRDRRHARGNATFEDLWHAADVAMYEAKRAGGNAVRLAPEAATWSQASQRSPRSSDHAVRSLPCPPARRSPCSTSGESGSESTTRGSSSCSW